MLLRSAALALALPLLACSEAQMCRHSALAPLSTLDRQIRQAEENIARGYEVIEVGDAMFPRRICRPVRERPPPPAATPPGHPPGAAPDRPRFPRDRPRAERVQAERLATRGSQQVVCETVYPEPRTLQRPVNVEAEAAKLASLRAQRTRLLPQVEARLAQCPAD